ncbi:MAG: bifunctional hydroxymethylpyrimidine kinase/phosphomethylpyrimidine kinase [Clostridia bacterium]|nr:bifunctional hydroxymethylpyrimidine kinase/phosphomethylpyrimidine kinase [Clostridia bacterium]
MAKRILVAGSSNIDFLLTTPYIPAPGETLISGGKYAFTPGGKGANAAIAAKAMGADVIFCSRVGDDAYGDRLIALFNERGIDTRYIKVDRLEQTGLAVVMLEKSGTNRIIVFSGANSKICDTDVEAAFSAYPDAVLTQFEIRPDAVIAAARTAAYEGIPFFVDAGPADAEFPLAKLEQVEIFSPNETETEILTGIRPNNLENCLRASIALCNKVDIKYVVLKLGERGCYIYDGKYCDLISPYDVPVVDTTAAGDVFTAALTTEYLRTNDIISSAKFANAAGALAVTKLGAVNSIPTLEEVRKLIG